MTSKRSEKELEERQEEEATLLDEESFVPRKRWDMKLLTILVLAASNVFLILALALSRYRYLDGQQDQGMPANIGWYTSSDLGSPSELRSRN